MTQRIFQIDPVPLGANLPPRVAHVERTSDAATALHTTNTDLALVNIQGIMDNVPPKTMRRYEKLFKDHLGVFHSSFSAFVCDQELRAGTKTYRNMEIPYINAHSGDGMFADIAIENIKGISLDPHFDGMFSAVRRERVGTVVMLPDDSDAALKYVGVTPSGNFGTLPRQAVKQYILRKKVPLYRTPDGHLGMWSPRLLHAITCELFDAGYPTSLGPEPSRGWRWSWMDKNLSLKRG